MQNSSIPPLSPPACAYPPSCASSSAFSFNLYVTIIIHNPHLFHSPNAVAAIQIIRRIMQLACTHHHLATAAVATTTTTHHRRSHLASSATLEPTIALRQSAGGGVAVLQPHRIRSIVVLHLRIRLRVRYASVHDLARHSISHSGRGIRGAFRNRGVGLVH